MSDDAKRKLEPPLHLDMPFEEALQRFAQTKPEEVEPAPGKKPKVAKAAKRLVSSRQSAKEPKDHKRQRDT